MRADVAACELSLAICAWRGAEEIDTRFTDPLQVSYFSLQTSDFGLRTREDIPLFSGTRSRVPPSSFVIRHS